MISTELDFTIYRSSIEVVNCGDQPKWQAAFGVAALAAAMGPALAFAPLLASG